MSLSKSDVSRVKRALHSRGFFVLLAICLVAVGAAAWLSIGYKPSKSVKSGDASDTSSMNTLSEYITHDSNGMRISSSDSSKSVGSVPTQNSSSGGSVSSATPQNKGRGENQSGTQQSANTTTSSQQTVAAVTPTADFFVMPLTGEILLDYSETELQYSTTFHDWRIHSGIDIKGKIGDVIKSAGDGTVTAVYNDSKWGQVVQINHGNGIVASYCGLDTAEVSVGDTVKVNQQIGKLGTVPCESLEDTHLHLSMTKSDTVVSPLSIIGM